MWLAKINIGDNYLNYLYLGYFSYTAVMFFLRLLKWDLWSKGVNKRLVLSNETDKHLLDYNNALNKKLGLAENGIIDVETDVKNLITYSKSHQDYINSQSDLPNTIKELHFF